MRINSEKWSGGWIVGILWVWCMCSARSKSGAVAAQMSACPHVKLSTERNTVEFYPPMSNLTSPHLPHSLPPSLPHLIDLTHSPAPHPPHLPHSLPLVLFYPQHPSPIRNEFRKSGRMGWFENLIASIRIKIRILSPVGNGHRGV
jgi:hypothetical protein